MGSLPSGIVAFLLTDVEASTRAWNRSPDDTEAAVAGLDLDVNAVVDAHRGSVVKARGEGDSHFAVFSEASRAIAATAALQRRRDTRLSLRACVLIGEARPRDGDYLSAVVNHGARIRSVAHGARHLRRGQRSTWRRVTFARASPSVPWESIGSGTYRLRSNCYSCAGQVFESRSPHFEPGPTPPRR